MVKVVGVEPVIVVEVAAVAVAVAVMQEAESHSESEPEGDAAADMKPLHRRDPEQPGPHAGSVVGVLVPGETYTVRDMVGHLGRHQRRPGHRCHGRENRG